MLFQIGPLTIDSPGGLNAQSADIEFGGDFAVKPVVGAAQPREFVGPSDRRLSLAGKIYPFRFAAAGVSSGLSESDLLQSMAESGEPQIVIRGDGLNLGFYVIEKGSIRHSNFHKGGIGKELEFRFSMVASPSSPSVDGLLGTLDLLFE